MKYDRFSTISEDNESAGHIIAATRKYQWAYNKDASGNMANLENLEKFPLFNFENGRMQRNLRKY